MKVGARNRIVGKITEVKKGSVMAQVKVEVQGPARLQSVLTVDSLDELGVKPGDTVEVIVKAVNVLIAKE